MKTIARLNLSENPFGISDSVKEIIKKEIDKITFYPSSDYSKLKEKLSQKLNVSVKCLYVGNGLDEVILALSLALDLKNKKVLIPDNTFMGYYFSSVVAKNNIKVIQLSNYSIDIDMMIAELEKGAGAIYLCNPHNPFGTIIFKRDLMRLLELCEKSKVYLIVDEAYIEFLEKPDDVDATPLVKDYHYLIVLRTFSKAYGLAGLRCGYACTSEEVTELLKKVENALPFRINRLAETAAIAALDDTQYLDMVRKKTIHNRNWLEQKLKQKNYTFVPSYSNFITVNVGNSKTLTDTLAKQYGIRIKNLDIMGLAGWIRISIGTIEQLEKLSELL